MKCLYGSNISVPCSRLVCISCAFILSSSARAYSLSSFSHRPGDSFRRSGSSSALASERQVELTYTAQAALPVDIYIRDAEQKDLRVASKILTDSFFSQNMFTIPQEWANSYYSLKDSLSNTGARYCMLVACKKSDDSVVAICEVDARQSKSPTENDIPRPFLCNLAVDGRERKRGIARVLVEICENRASGWNSSHLHLRVKQKNVVATEMYERIGYRIDGAYAEPFVRGPPIYILKKSIDKSILKFFT